MFKNHQAKEYCRVSHSDASKDASLFGTPTYHRVILSEAKNLLALALPLLLIYVHHQ